MFIKNTIFVVKKGTNYGIEPFFFFFFKIRRDTSVNHKLLIFKEKVKIEKGLLYLKKVQNVVLFVNM